MEQARFGRALAGASLLYTPPCSPDFNLIENAFAKLKALSRKAAVHSIDGLWNAIRDALPTFTLAECVSYFAAAGPEPERRKSALSLPRSWPAIQRMLSQRAEPRCPNDVIALIVLRRLRYHFTLQDLSEMFLERDILFSHEAVREWEAKLIPLLTAEFRQRFRGKSRSRRCYWFVYQIQLKVRGRWHYLYRATDHNGDVIDTMLSGHRDMAAAKAFPRSAKSDTGKTPGRITTDGHSFYLRAIRSVLGRHVRH